MADHFDVLETRDPAMRERDLFARLPAQIAHAMTAPGWAKQLAGIDPKSVTSRAALGKLPVLRKSALPALQKETPPFGGFNATPTAKAKRLFMSPGPIFEPEGHTGDYNGARALFAAGVRAGDVVNPPNGGFLACRSLSALLRRTGSLASAARELTEAASTPFSCSPQPGAFSIARRTRSGSRLNCASSRWAGSRTSSWS